MPAMSDGYVSRPQGQAPTFDAELCESQLAVMVPQQEVEVLPRQLLLILEARLPEHGLHHLRQLGLGQAVVGDLDEGPGVGGGKPSGPEKKLEA